MNIKMNIFGRRTDILPASNGFIVKVGCTVFVKKGKIEELTPLLVRYFNIDESLVKAYGKTASVAFWTSSPQAFEPEGGNRHVRPTPYPEIEGSNCPALRYLEESSYLKLTTTYRAANGLITVNYEDNTVMVEETSVVLVRQ